jgi:thioredoxin-related protein
MRSPLFIVNVAAALTLLATACSDPPAPPIVEAPSATAPAASAASAPTATAPAAPVATSAAPKKVRVALDNYAAYDASKDGKAQVEAAQAEAKQKSKRVMVMFGGNWCKWCKALDGTFASHPEVKAVLEKGFVLVHVDSDSSGALNDAWGNPFANGFPVLVILDADGRKLHVQETGSLEKEDKTVAHDPDKVLAFLKQWSPPGA